MSPRTSTWTEILGSCFDASGCFSSVRGGECRVYLVGSHSSMIMKVVEASTARVRSNSNMRFRSMHCVGWSPFTEYGV
jgi:hypothetical protein